MHNLHFNFSFFFWFMNCCVHVDSWMVDRARACRYNTSAAWSGEHPVVGMVKTKLKCITQRYWAEDANGGGAVDEKKLCTKFNFWAGKLFEYIQQETQRGVASEWRRHQMKLLRQQPNSLVNLLDFCVAVPVVVVGMVLMTKLCVQLLTLTEKYTKHFWCTPLNQLPASLVLRFFSFVFKSINYLCGAR